MTAAGAGDDGAAAGIDDGAGDENICVYSLGPECAPPGDEEYGMDGVENAPVAVCEDDEGGANDGE